MRALFLLVPGAFAPLTGYVGGRLNELGRIRDRVVHRVKQSHLLRVSKGHGSLNDTSLYLVFRRILTKVPKGFRKGQRIGL